MRSGRGEASHFVILSPYPQVNANRSKLCNAVGLHSDPPLIGCKCVLKVHLENYIERYNSFEASLDKF